MKNPAVLKFILITLIFFQGFVSHSQNPPDGISFSVRYNKNVRGDILLIGNNILNRDGRWKMDSNGSWTKEEVGDLPNVPYNDSGINNDFIMRYIDIDEDADTFNSSSANLNLPDPDCSKIIYAGLYWGAVEKGNDPIDRVILKTPDGGYNYISGTAVYVKTDSYYASYANVTSYITRLSKPDGTYTVANVSTAQGNNSTGLSAGWSLFIVYENATSQEKTITSFDGFGYIDGVHNLDIPISGFTTASSGDVHAKFAFSALEGDQNMNGDYLEINGSRVRIQERPMFVWHEYSYDNFFNSSVTSSGSIFRDRNPDSSNTLGFDAGVFKVPNDKNSVIKNGDISAKITLGTEGDVYYYYYFNAFAVESIAPRIVTVEEVSEVDDRGNEYDVRNHIVETGKEIRYKIKFQNKGNDDAENFTITDILPANVVFDKTELPAGVTARPYDLATRTIIFDIAPSLVTAPPKGTTATAQTIRIIAKTTDNCESLTDACSNVVQNTATSSYTGKINTAAFGSGTLAADEGICTVGVPTPVTFYIGRDKCKFEKTVFLCDGSAVLKAGNGYTSYDWIDSGGNVIGYNQQFTATKADTYTVRASSSSCPPSITQTFYVSRENPLNKFADNINSSTHLPYACTSDGKPFPKIFLCTKDAKKEITLDLTGATTISWQENKGAPPSSLDDDCPNKSSLTWTAVSTGSTYTADKAGAYRLIVTYNNTVGAACTNTFYFNVTKNVIEPAFTKQDVICKTKGSITITKPIAAGGHSYEYSLDGVAYQDSNVFNNMETGTYKVHIRTKATATKFENCEYTTDEIKIVDKSTTLAVNLTLTTPLTDCNKGEITVSATNGVEPYSCYVDDFTTPRSLPTIPVADAREYKVKVSDSNNCETTATITVTKIPGPTTTAIELD